MSERVLLISHLQVQNANALSSPITIGFPAMTAWLGFVHALQRKLNEQGLNIRFPGVGVVSHQFDLQVHRGDGDFVNSIIGTANPLQPKSKKGKPLGYAERPSFIEEARCHLVSSIVVRYENVESHEEEEVCTCIERLLRTTLKLAGGDIIDWRSVQFMGDFRRLQRALLPGYALIERRELVEKAMHEGQDALDVVLDYLSIEYSAEKRTDKEGKITGDWKGVRKATTDSEERGWIVPIATGFHAISPLGKAKNSRVADDSHRFVESLVTLGEFRMAHRLDSLDQFFWAYQTPHDNLYLCHRINQSEADSAYGQYL